MGHHGLDETEMSHLQDVCMVQDLFGRQTVQIATAALAGIVDQYVDAAPGRCDLLDERFDAGGIGHVDRASDHVAGAARLQFFCGGTDIRLRARTDCDARTFGGERPAMARPMPRDAPVTMTRLSFRLIYMLSPGCGCPGLPVRICLNFSQFKHKRIKCAQNECEEMK
jgi:hypothetical protein